LAAFVVVLAAVLAGAAFFVAIILGSFRGRTSGTGFGKLAVSLWYPIEKDNSKSRHSMKE
jgi:hypothetical protein